MLLLFLLVTKSPRARIPTPLIHRTIGKFVSGLIENKRYQNIILPAIPVVVKREWDMNLIKLEALNNREFPPGSIEHGDSVMSFYAVDMKWYPAKIVSVLREDLFYVIYDVYNNKEVRTRGHVLMKGEELQYCLVFKFKLE